MLLCWAGWDAQTNKTFLEAFNLAYICLCMLCWSRKNTKYFGKITHFLEFLYIQITQSVLKVPEFHWVNNKAAECFSYNPFSEPSTNWFNRFMLMLAWLHILRQPRHLKCKHYLLQLKSSTQRALVWSSSGWFHLILMLRVDDWSSKGWGWSKKDITHIQLTKKIFKSLHSPSLNLWSNMK